MSGSVSPRRAWLARVNLAVLVQLVVLVFCAFDPAGAQTCGAAVCPQWCDCVGGVCQPSPVQINAVRFRTSDGRYLQALNGGGAGLVAANVSPQNRETFRLASPTTFPLASGDPIVLEVADANWGPSGFLVRVDANIIPSGQLWFYRFGGPDAGVWVTACCRSNAGYAGWTDEWTFSIMKAGGGPIATGDQVTLSTSGGFLFRTTGSQSGAPVNADATTAAVNTLFTVEFSQVVVGRGWRPASVQCQTCGTVTGIVTDASTGLPIFGATVQAQGIGFAGTTGASGTVSLSDPNGGSCVPAGPRILSTSANTYQPQTNSVTVPAGGGVTVPIQLNCTNVSGKVLDGNGQPVAGADVILVDANGNPVVRSNNTLIEATTAGDGTFVLHCVPHGNWGVWTDGAGTVAIIVPPAGLTNVVITKGCGDVVGTVTNANTGQPISGAKVKVIGTGPGVGETTTDAAGNFRIPSVCPPGAKSLRTTAVGYQSGTNPVTVPASGSSPPVQIKLLPLVTAASEITIELTWGAQPRDLDSHLSGPDGQGGRFHLFYANRMTPPVNFASLNVDDQDGNGPEKITVRPTSSGTFIAGVYRYWVHNYTASTLAGSASTFAGSNAVVKVFQGGAQLGQFAVASATGSPADALWRVVDLQISANGTVVLSAVQTFQVGGSSTTF